MALTSPRFRNEPELKRVEAHLGALRQGSHGRHVHLVQMALIDLGFAMPISTQSPDFSPDGIFGAETEGVVKAFQTSTPGLKPDGALGPLTLRELDRRLNRFTHRINLHFRALSLTDVPFDRMLTSAEQVYAQYGIEARFASGQSLGLSTEAETRFTVIGQNCGWELDSGEFAELHKLGTPVPTSDIAIFIVSRFQQSNVLGCGGHAKNRPACAVTHNCSRWDVAHEIGHVLLTSAFVPVHTGSRQNLMFPTSSNGPTPLTLTDKQLRAIRASPLCRSI